VKRTRVGVVVGALALVGASAAGCAGDPAAGPGTSAVPATTTPAPPAWTERDVALDTGKVRVACHGEGSPTVVMVSNLAEDGATTWGHSGVPDRVASGHQVCIYDRPGLGASDPAAGPRSVEAHVADLEALVAAGAFPAPVLLVSQGYGTFIARQFAADHTDQVAGLVLVDPPLWPYDYDVPEGLTEGEEAEYLSTLDINMRLAEYGPASLPPPPKPTYVIGVDWALPFLPPTLDGVASPPQPPTTRQAGEPPDQRRESQRQLAAKSPFGRFVAMDQAGSYAQYWDPAAVAGVIDRSLADAARTASR
jgi:pimeloyl-ACP methyl ester carboxylesterase